MKDAHEDCRCDFEEKQKILVKFLCFFVQKVCDLIESKLYESSL